MTGSGRATSPDALGWMISYPSSIPQPLSLDIRPSSIESWLTLVFNDVCRELAEFCCSVDERREVDRRINRTFESTHSANLHATRPVVSGKTEAEISVAVTWISWT